MHNKESALMDGPYDMNVRYQSTKSRALKQPLYGKITDGKHTVGKLYKHYKDLMKSSYKICTLSQLCGNLYLKTLQNRDRSAHFEETCIRVETQKMHREHL